MPETYTRLNEEERYQIYEGVTEKCSHRKIATLINKHHSTVAKEVKRNTGLRGYRPKQAQEIALQRHHNKPRHIKLTADVQALITENIKHERSPEQIQGRLKSEGVTMVCATTIMGSFRKTERLEESFIGIFARENFTKSAPAHQRLEAKLSAYINRCKTCHC
jgi:IS30 family transposase